MILIFTDKLNPRIEYISNVLFTSILRHEVSYTCDADAFAASSHPKLNYSERKFENAINIRPHGLLFSRELTAPDIHPVRYGDHHLFFESSDDSDLPFDPLAAAFYLVTRYEEYLSSPRDAHGRFPAEESILTKYNLLKKPVVNIWARTLGEKLQIRFPAFRLPVPRFSFLPTIDIDNAWAYAHKGFLRSAAALSRAVMNGNRTEVKSRMEVWRHKKPDPYDTYRWLHELFEGREEQVRFFFLLGDYGRYDKNISWKNRHLQQLIQETAQRYPLGIHPSCGSSPTKESKRVMTELKRLETITGTKITNSRFHFLKLQLPGSYRHLQKAGILEDYTMGYPSHTGFRAGICTPYLFYDLEKETTTSLTIIPFQVMDVTLKNYMGLSPEQAMTEIEALMQEVRNTGGTFSVVWHNESLTDKGAWSGYRDVFKRMNQLGYSYSNE